MSFCFCSTGNFPSFDPHKENSFLSSRNVIVDAIKATFQTLEGDLFVLTGVASGAFAFHILIRPRLRYTTKIFSHIVTSVIIILFVVACV